MQLRLKIYVQHLVKLIKKGEFKMEEIYVDWSGPYTYEDVVNYNENKIETKKFAVKPTDFSFVSNI